MTADPALPAGTLPGRIVEEVRARIAAGSLRPGDRLDSTRVAAARHGVSRGTVVAAYEQLTGEGYLVTSRSGTRVNPRLPDLSLTPVPGAAPRDAAADRQPVADPAHDGDDFSAGAPPSGRRTGAAAPLLLTPGVPDTAPLTSTAWRRAWRSAAADPCLGYSAPGSPRLVAAIAEHVRLSRSIASGHVVVTAGARDGMRLVLSALAARGTDGTDGTDDAPAGAPTRRLTVAVENPGYPSLRAVPERLGHRVVPVGVDAGGVDLAALDALRPVPDAVLVTPSHQYPLGAAMSAERRFALLRWAARAGVVVIEDDYDSELRYVGEPLPALAGLDTTGSVVTLGSFAKSLSPGLGLGFLVVPGRLRAGVLAAAKAGTPVSGIVQDAAANFLAEGGLRRHTARMRRAYRRRRDIFVDVFAAYLAAPAAADDPTAEATPGAAGAASGATGTVTARPMDGGLHAVLLFAGGGVGVESRVVTAARAVGLGVTALSDYWRLSPGQEGVAGVVVGIGTGSEERLRAGLNRLRSCIEGCGLRPAR